MLLSLVVGSAGFAFAAPLGQASDFETPTASTGPHNIGVGPDSNLRATENVAGKIAKIDPRIARFAATPSGRSASGGRVVLRAVVRNATTCRFSVHGTLKGLPTTKGCKSGKASVKIELPRNRTSSAKTYRFSLTARGSNGRTTPTPVAPGPGRTWLERPPPATRSPPRAASIALSLQTAPARRRRTPRR
jgi:hypothetical protein